MNRKIPSAITGISLNRATFNHVPIEQLTFINFFYGNNGAGKSSIAHAIEENDGIEWADGKAADDYDVLVYNQDFINKNFSDYANLPGVFTVNEVNIKIQETVDEKMEQKKRLETQRKDAVQEWQQKQSAPDALLAAFQTKCWSSTVSVRADFDNALDGKKQKKGLADAVLSEKNPREHDLMELKRLYDIAFDDTAKAYPEFSRVDKAPTYGRLPGKDLLDKVIVSSSDTPFAQFMKALNASDWVRDGHAHYAGAAAGRCPYCQRALPEGFEDEIAACFDAQYQQDIQDLQQFQRTYANETAGIIKRLKDNTADVIAAIDLAEYQTKLKLLENSFGMNNQRLAEKVKEPTKVIALEDTDSLLLELGDLIDAINLQIKANNDVVAEKRTSKANCKKWILEHLAFMLADDIKGYRDGLAELEKEIEDIKMRGQKLKKDISALTADLSRLHSQAVNTQAAIAGINRILKDSGFQGFCLREKEGVRNTYEIIRENRESDGPAQGLSEGERNFIAFLYFYHLARGSRSSGEVKEKIVVIDDPVSSMDSTALFLVSSIVREMVNVCRSNTEYLSPKAPGDYIKQLFILTHNVYFHRQVTCQQVGLYGCTSFYIIRKSGNVSSVSLCERQSARAPSERENYNPVQSSYAALWDELRELQSTLPALNVMRRILEYYFLEMCGYEGGGLREIVLEQHKDQFIIPVEDGQPDMTNYQLASSMLAYINNPHGISDGLSYVEESDDVQAYKRVFKLIFETLNQNQHYNMMMGAPLHRTGSQPES